LTISIKKICKFRSKNRQIDKSCILIRKIKLIYSKNKPIPAKKSNNSASILTLNFKIDHNQWKILPIPAKKLNNIRQNVEVKLRNWPFLLKKYANSGQKSTNNIEKLDINLKNWIFLFKKHANSYQKVEQQFGTKFGLNWKIDHNR